LTFEREDQNPNRTPPEASPPEPPDTNEPEQTLPDLLDRSRTQRTPGRRRNEPLSGEVLPRPDRAETPPPASAPPIDLRYNPPPEQSMLGNPYIVAGVAVAGAIVLAVLVVVLFGGSDSTSGSNNGTPNPGAVINPLTPQPGSGVQARSLATATVREGPSVEFLEIGTLRAGQDVDVLGRNADATWFQLLFPPQSTLRGWVPASALRVPEASVSSIPVVASTPIPRPTVILPTPTPGPTETETPTPTPTGTVTPSVGPDMQASAVPGTCSVGQRLVISVRNLGPPAITSRAITILVQTPEGQQRAIATQTVTLPAGQTVDIDTGYVVQERVTVIVDPLGTLGDVNVSNNRVDCIVTGAGPSDNTPTRTPSRTPTPRRTPD
jgi:hypothetical protein